MDQRRFLYSRSHFFNWFLLAFLAGSVNAGGYLACQRFVSHVTGFATLFGVDLAQKRFLDAAGMLSIPLFFLMGSMISAMLIERRLHRAQLPLYSVAMTLVFCCLVLATFGGYANWFGIYGEPMRLKNDYLLLALLCTASGLQNAIITSVSGAVVRTTHLTGITTDLGIGLVRVLFPGPHDRRINEERRFNKLRIGTIGFFIAGSAAGALLCQKFGYFGFLLPTTLALYAVIAAKLTWEKRIQL